MTSASVLFPSDSHETLNTSPPACFVDLGLDRVVSDVAAIGGEYDVQAFFNTPLRDVTAIRFRQHVMCDVDRRTVRAVVVAFGASMRRVRAALAEAAKSHYVWEGRLLFLAAALDYSSAVTQLKEGMASAAPESPGLRAIARFLAAYTTGSCFAALEEGARTLSAEVKALRYTLHIENGSVTVRPYRDETDFSANIEETFSRFRSEAVESFLVAFRDDPLITHVDAWILDGLAAAFRSTFEAVSGFVENHQDFVDAQLAQFEQEIHIYVAYLSYIERSRGQGLAFCNPVVTESRELSIHAGFDLALATLRAAGRDAVVVNDVVLGPDERFLVITGPNQGGKTTFARMIGQAAYLAALGLPVPGSAATVPLFDHVFTHFESSDHVETQRGRLHDDLVRLRVIFELTTPNSLVILNELFSSTTLEDAVWLSRQALADLSSRDCRAVWVTFLSELASYNDQTVSYVSQVEPDDPSRRTYRIRRGPASDTAYALLLAEKYRVTSERLRERLDP